MQNPLFVLPVGSRMKTLSARYGFGRLIARAAPAGVEKHGRPVRAVAEFERLTGDTVSPSQEKGED